MEFLTDYDDGHLTVEIPCVALLELDLPGATQLLTVEASCYAEACNLGTWYVKEARLLTEGQR